MHPEGVIVTAHGPEPRRCASPQDAFPGEGTTPPTDQIACPPGHHPDRPHTETPICLEFRWTSSDAWLTRHDDPPLCTSDLQPRHVIRTSGDFRELGVLRKDHIVTNSAEQFGETQGVLIREAANTLATDLERQATRELATIISNRSASPTSSAVST
jgi:hypothetical protein